MSGPDTIFAVSSGVGRSGVAVIRISGEKCRHVLEEICGGVCEPRLATLRAIDDPRMGMLDRGLVLWFPGPASFTGEDVIELHVHGGKAIVSAVLASLGHLDGLRAARAGEFSERAFNNGKLDLTAVEGLADLIDSETEGQRRSALMHADGHLGLRYAEWRSEVIRLRGLVEASIDFVDEDDVPVDLVSDVVAGCERLSGEMKSLLATRGRGEKLRDGMLVVICGKPNVGKSSLMNWLVQRDVAIVSDVPGTTRDAIEVQLDLDGVAVRIVDTAGLRENTGPIETEGVRRAKALISKADLVLELIDSSADHFLSSGLDGDISGDNDVKTVWPVLSKSDLMVGDVPGMRHRISVLQQTGLAELLDDLSRFAADCAGFTGDLLMVDQRHGQELERACVLIDEVAGVFDVSRAEVSADALRGACDCLGRLTGAIHTEDVLGDIFHRFCIGK